MLNESLTLAKLDSKSISAGYYLALLASWRVLEAHTVTAHTQIVLLSTQVMGAVLLLLLFLLYCTEVDQSSSLGASGFWL